MFDNIYFSAARGVASYRIVATSKEPWIHHIFTKRTADLILDTRRTNGKFGNWMVFLDVLVVCNKLEIRFSFSKMFVSFCFFLFLCVSLCFFLFLPQVILPMLTVCGVGCLC